MMTWDEVMEYYDDVVEISFGLSKKNDPSLRQDAIQHTLLELHQRLDLTRIKGSKRSYVRGAIWKTIQRFYRDDNRHSYTRLEDLASGGVQINHEGELVWTGRTGIYTGTLVEEDVQE